MIVVDISPKANSLSPLAASGARAFIDRTGGGGWVGLHAETAELAMTVIFKLVISGLTSIILIVLGMVNLQFHGSYVSNFSEASSRSCGSSCLGYSPVIM